jgi:hypothetical protein
MTRQQAIEQAAYKYETQEYCSEYDNGPQTSTQEVFIKGAAFGISLAEKESEVLVRALEKILESPPDEEVPDFDDVDAAEKWCQLNFKRKKIAREALDKWKKKRGD